MLEQLAQATTIEMERQITYYKQLDLPESGWEKRSGSEEKWKIISIEMFNLTTDRHWSGKLTEIEN